MLGMNESYCSSQWGCFHGNDSGWDTRNGPWGTLHENNTFDLAALRSLLPEIKRSQSLSIKYKQLVVINDTSSRGFLAALRDSRLYL
jgi:hypothetical protein